MKADIPIRTKKKFKTNPVYVVVFIILIIYLVGLLLPLLWGFLVSFVPSNKYYEYVQSNPLRWPPTLTFDTYIHGFTNFSIKTPEVATTGDAAVVRSLPEIILYSILYAGGCGLAATLTPCIVSYLVARYDFKFGKIIYGIVIVTMSIPIVGNLPSEIRMAQMTGVYNRIWGLWIMRMNFLGIYFLLFHSIFRKIPRAYTEAAKIDGAGNFKIMLKVIMPFALSTMGIVFLLNFINFWNDYQVPNYYLPSYPVVGYSIFFFSNESNANSVGYTGVDGKFHFGYIPQVFAMIFIVAIPIIILAIIFNKKLMGNLSDGGIKE